MLRTNAIAALAALVPTSGCSILFDGYLFADEANETITVSRGSTVAFPVTLENSGPDPSRMVGIAISIIPAEEETSDWLYELDPVIFLEGSEFPDPSIIPHSETPMISDGDLDEEWRTELGGSVTWQDNHPDMGWDYPSNMDSTTVLKSGETLDLTVTIETSEDMPSRVVMTPSSVAAATTSGIVYSKNPTTTLVVNLE